MSSFELLIALSMSLGLSHVLMRAYQVLHELMSRRRARMPGFYLPYPRRYIGLLQPYYDLYFSREFHSEQYVQEEEPLPSYEVSGREQFLSILRSLDAVPRASFRTEAWYGDQLINNFVRLRAPELQNELRSNAALVGLMAPFHVNLRNVHNGGDQIEAAYYLSSEDGRLWFREMLMSVYAI